MEIYVGLMSGTSADGIDAVLLNMDENNSPTVIGHNHLPFSEELASRIGLLCQAGDNEIERLGEMEYTLGHLFADATDQLLAQHDINARQIRAIGSHGQTIRHRPPSQSATPFTLQVGDPNVIAERTGITTVADFRRRDIACGGEGAPLVPAFHIAVFSNRHEARVILNIGGIANLTQLSKGTGFDTGPGNTLMDAWHKRHCGGPYDNRGQWAATGKVDQSLLKMLMQHDYFDRKPPKSTGREAFNLEWLDDLLASSGLEIDPVNVQATLLELTAQSISQSVASLGNIDAIYVCGGGAENTALMTRLEQLASSRVRSTQALGIAPQHVEAAAFAWLASQTLKGNAGNCPAATGAKYPRILGAIYQA